ncbi:GntR family transcriptional regulator [Streptomyces sp. NPDC050560]|uniref:GntR family transcriptional regulator n=1 Tax=Streptomyces sp. NPDC050560 TaxID=3365630 RepID=UPI003798335B
MAPRPMYEVIRGDILDQINTGILPPETRLPSESELAERYGVSRMTVRQALDSLNRERILVRRRGAGTFVSPSRPGSRRVNRLRPFRDDVMGDPATVTTAVLLRESTAPPAEVAEALGLADGGRDATRIVRLRTVDDEPAAVQESWVPSTVAPGLLRGELVEGSLYRTLADTWGVELSWADQQISAASATEQLAAWLSVRPGDPLIRANRTTHDSTGRAVEWAVSWTRPEFPFVMRLEA